MSFNCKIVGVEKCTFFGLSKVKKKKKGYKTLQNCVSGSPFLEVILSTKVEKLFRNNDRHSVITLLDKDIRYSEQS